MEKTKKRSKFRLVLISLVLIIVLGISGALVYVSQCLPNVGKPEELKVELTPERIARGRYLANHVNVCIDCHSTRDWSMFSGPIAEGSMGMGGETFDQKFGFPGSFIAPNITPAGLSSWTDGELLRAISSGVSKDGRALFPVMPHPAYGKMDREDLYAIIAYIRTLPAIEHQVSASKADFPMNFIINTIPQKATYGTKPDTADKVAYGQYMFNAAACGDCHTKQEKGQKIAGMELAGGFEFMLPSGGKAISANLTPDAETGLGNWSEQQFIQAFKRFANAPDALAHVEQGSFNTVMPWSMYAGLTETDLSAIYAYLRTVKPISNKVMKFVKN